MRVEGPDTCQEKITFSCGFDAMGHGHSSELHPLNILAFCEWRHRGICTQLNPTLRSCLQLTDGQGSLASETGWDRAGAPSRHVADKATE